jgi:hypothetical protein
VLPKRAAPLHSKELPPWQVNPPVVWGDAGLLEGDTCLGRIALLVQLIANHQLDPQSRRLLTTSLLLGIPKPGSDTLRPLAMGELFLKLAAKL